jgi:hypothetical protein
MAVEQHVRCARSEKRTVVTECFHGRHQVAIGIGFHDVRPHTGLDNVAHELIGEVQGQYHYFRFGKALADAPGGFQAIELGHTDVHHYHVRLKLLGHGYSLSPSLSLGYHIPAMVRGEQLLQSAPDNVVIISD